MERSYVGGVSRKERKRRIGRTELQLLVVTAVFVAFVSIHVMNVARTEHVVFQSLEASKKSELASAVRPVEQQYQSLKINRKEETKDKVLMTSTPPKKPKKSTALKTSKIENISAPTTMQKLQRHSVLDAGPEFLPREHPHAGARFPNGTWGYVADVTRVRKWMLQRYSDDASSSSSSGLPSNGQMDRQLEVPPLSYLPISPGTEFEYICNKPPKSGNEKKAGWRLLARKVKVFGSDDTYYLYNTTITNATKNNLSNVCYSKKDNISSSVGENSNEETDRQTETIRHHQSKLLCAIYTYQKNHDRVRAIAETWGWRCDGFFAASTKTVDTAFKGSTHESGHNDESSNSVDVGFGAIDLPHEGAEDYKNMWQKTRSVWAYIHDNYLDQFDYFFLSGDDTHVIVENLRHLLDSCFNSSGPNKETTSPLYLGHWVPDSSNGYFIGGGPGYVLNRKSLQRLVQEALPACLVNHQGSAEDRFIGSCFRNIGIVGNHSVDSQGSQTFHGMDTHFVSSFDPTKTENRPFFRAMYKFWASFYGHKVGIDLVSSHSIAFHLLRNPLWMKRHHAILYRSCPIGTAIGDALFSIKTDTSWQTKIIPNE